MDLTIITHTHSDCKDLWAPYFDSYSTYFNQGKHIVLINKHSDDIKHPQIVYDDTQKYSNRLIQSLKTIDSKYVLISFEDMLLYDYVKINHINDVIEYMDKNEHILYTRLIKSGIKSNNHIANNLYNVEYGDFQFSITPTIWRLSDLLALLTNLTDLSIWDLEVKGDILFRTNNIKGLYYYNGENKRGGHHDSSIYPHICSAILKGKWNMSEYANELIPIISKYKIDINEKGVV